MVDSIVESMIAALIGSAAGFLISQLRYRFTYRHSDVRKFLHNETDRAYACLSDAERNRVASSVSAGTLVTRVEVLLQNEAHASRWG